MPKCDLISYEITEEGYLIGLYSEVVDLYAIGQITDVRRASHIRFNEQDQVWETTDARTRQVVHRDKSRSAAVQWEISAFSPGGEHYHEAS